MTNYNLEAVLEAIKKHKEEEKKKSSGLDFLKIQQGQSIDVAFVAGIDSNLIPDYIEYEEQIHFVDENGNKKRTKCLGENCPICAKSKDFYKNGDKVNGALYSKQNRWISRVLAVNENKVYRFSFGRTIKQILDVRLEDTTDAADVFFNPSASEILKLVCKNRGGFSDLTGSRFLGKRVDVSKHIYNK